MSHEVRGARGVSPQLDRLSCDLIGASLDTLAAGGEVLSVASVSDATDNRLTCAFEDDSPEACLEGARAWVRRLAKAGGSPKDGLTAPTCYAIAYEGAVADERGTYHDALLIEFGDEGAATAYSAFVLVDGIGSGEGFSWSDPQPAGEEEPLL